MQDRVLGDFVLGELLGEGGFGTVYRAEQRGLGRAAVVKVIRRSLTTRPEAVERFAREARLASHFDHPYAAHIYAFGVEADGLMWIAMELVKGVPLSQLLRRSGPLPIERFVPLFERLCEVIESAHDQGIVHRDIKPSNVMVITRAGRLMPKLLDFGIAKLVTSPMDPTGEDPRPAGSAVGVPTPRTRPSPMDPSGDDPRPAGSAVGVPTSRTRPSPIDPTGDDPRPTGAAVAQGSASPAPPAPLDDTVKASASLGSSESLTREGQVLGSPVYMAPEQWLDAQTAGPAADQYALALLAYEALTGARAFLGPTVEDLAQQHLHAPLPALPPPFPAALHGVLARAASKSPERRFTSVAEFSIAVRAATGVGALDLDDAIPALPVELRTEWVNDAPRPIAESLAALTHARTPTRAGERIAAVASLLARWVGALAIACRSRLGRADDAASLETELLLELRRRPLRDTEWLDLALALVRHQLELPELWPIPEMAGFLASDDAIASFRALLRDGGVGIEEAIAREALERRIAQLAVVLDNLGWLLDYTLAREVPDGLELWMGQRSDERSVQRMASDGSGAIVLLDSYVARIVRLSPLFVVAPPAPGEPEEMFVFSGPGRSEDGARFISYPRSFEREHDGVWPWLAEHLLETAPQASARRRDDSSPYPGLAAFTAGDCESFVGRERDVEELVNRLRTHAIVAVIGPSGIGKTSFLAAGVVPALGVSRHCEIIRPGNDPIGMLAGIADRIASSPYREGDSEPATTPAGIAAALAALAERRGTHLVVIVDQAEELFTMCSDEATREAFAEALIIAASHARVRVVVTLRDDFLCRADQLTAWRGRIGSCVQVLRVPRRDDLERMIAVPARRRGYDFDDPALPAEIATQVAGRPGALPLLAFTAAKLWEQRDRHFNRLTRANYEQIGGVTGALVKHADGVLERMTAPDRRLVRLAFRRLLSADGTRVLIGHGELESALGGTSAARTVIASLLAARLLVSRDDDAGDRIEIIHETLATTWPRLASWRREDADGARLQEQLAVAARHWDERHRPAELLWRGAALVDLVRWQATTDHSMTELEAAFARASVAAATGARRRRLGAVAAAFAILGTGVFGLVVANSKIADQRAAAVGRLAANFEERGRLALADGDAARAMLFLAEAARLGAHGPGFDLLTSQAAAPLGAGLQIVGHNKAGIESLPAGERLLTIDTDLALNAWDRTGRSMHLADDIRSAATVGDLTIALSRQGDVVAIDRDDHVRWRAHTAAVMSRFSGVAGSPAGFVVSFGGTAAIWDLATGQLRAELPGKAPVSAVAIDSTGARIATGDLAGSVTIWNATTATQLAVCEPHTRTIRAIGFTPDGVAVVTGSDDGEVRICNASSGATVHRLLGHSHQVLTVDVSPDNGAIISGGRDGKPRLWDARTGLLLAVLEGHRGAVWIARFSPDGSRLLTLGSDDGSARLWNRDGMSLGSLQGHGGRLDAGYWEPDGKHVITAGTDGAIRRWDVELAIRAYPARAHATSISHLAVSSDGNWALTAGGDGAALWDLHAHQPRVRLPSDAKMYSVAFARDVSTALTTDAAGVARLWSIPDGAPRATFAASGVTVASYTADPGVIVTAGSGQIRFWTPAGSQLAAIPVAYPVEQLVTEPSGRWLIVRGPSRSMLIVDLATRTTATELAIRDGTVRAVAASASHIAASDGRAIRLWQLGTWAPAGELVGHRSNVSDLWFLADGRLVSFADDTTLVWDRDGQVRGRLSEGEPVFDTAAPADGTFIATTSTDGALRIWDATTYRRLLVLPSHRLPTFHCGITRDSGLALSAGSDGRLVTWQLDRRTRSPAELAEIVRCRVPLRLDGDVALPRELDFDDPTCATLP